ncbi:phosphopantetheine-binding protein [Streptomyces sp. NPDC050560]|uniref:phosphopantetheine-binding protein n=1 Tax=Streptomyces sp. NPDC050560 TaxID=3365630 RepID=UPI0037ABE9E2
MDTSTLPAEGELRAIVAPLLGLAPDEIEPDGNLVLLGLSSLEIMRLVSRWRKAKVPVQFDALVAAPTLNGWLAHFASLAPAAPSAEPA